MYDFGPNENYQESLKALRVMSRMPAMFFVPAKKTKLPALGMISSLKKRQEQISDLSENSEEHLITTPILMPTPQPV